MCVDYARQYEFVLAVNNFVGDESFAPANSFYPSIIDKNRSLGYAETSDVSAVS